MTRGRAAGFTLIETVIAFAVLSVSLAALYSAYEGSLSRSAHDARLSNATLIAQSLLARAGTEWEVDAPMREGIEAGYSYRVAQEITSGAGTGRARLVKVRVSVMWSESSGPHEFSLDTLKLLPRART